MVESNGMNAAEAVEVATQRPNGVAYSVVLSTGQEVGIYKCKTKHIAMFAAFISSVFEDLGIESLSAASGLQSIPPAKLLKLISNRSEDLVKLVAASTTATAEEVEDMDIDDLVEVCRGWWIVNQDFFSRMGQTLAE